MDKKDDDDGKERLLEEDKYGRLICRKTRKVHPKGEKLSKESMKEAFNDESPSGSISSSEIFSDNESDKSKPPPKTNSEAKVFIGGATQIEAEKNIGFCGFVIYYRMPEDESIPFSLPLMLAYKSSQNQYFHFPISQRKYYDCHRKVQRSMFKVECGDILMAPSLNNHLIPGFFSLEALIKYYKTFAYHDAEKGTLEIFPLGTIGSKRV